jgi:hypothetical protein
VQFVSRWHWAAIRTWQVIVIGIQWPTALSVRGERERERNEINSKVVTVSANHNVMSYNGHECDISCILDSMTVCREPW